MKHPLFRLISLFSLFIVLTLSACGPPGTGTESQNQTGNQASDNATAPDQAQGGKSLPYSERNNLLNPNHFEFFQDFERYRAVPFNRDFLVANNIGEIKIAHYNDDDNDFSENVNDVGKVLSGEKRLQFDREGKLTILETERYADGKPWVKLAVQFEYDASGKRIKELIRDHAFDDIKESEVNYVYKSDGSLYERNDPAGISSFYGYDTEKGHTYVLEVTPAGSATVRVKGKTGDFPDATCIALQDEILTLASPHVRYKKAPGLVRDVIFYEMDGRKIVRQVNMGANGVITGTVDHAYNEFDNLTTQRFLWEDTQALFRSEKVFRYGPGNDLTEIIRKKVRNNGENSTEIWRYAYSPEGDWKSFKVISRVENGPEEVKELNLVSITKGDAQAKPKPRSAPGATN